MSEQDIERTRLEIIWYKLMQEAEQCRRTWGMGFPVISTELLRKHWHEATGQLPPEAPWRRTPKR